MSGDISSVLTIIAPNHIGGTTRPAVDGDGTTERDAAAEERLQPARNGLDSLVQAKANLKRQRKSFAKAKVERLKQELNGLRLGGDVNPKGAARRAIQIARELGSASREFIRVHATHGAGAAAPTEGDVADVAETLTRTADAFLCQDDSIGTDPRFATKIRQLFACARNVVEEQRRRAAEDGRDDREYITLVERTRVLGIAIDNSIADSATVPPLDIKI